MHRILFRWRCPEVARAVADDSAPVSRARPTVIFTDVADSAEATAPAPGRLQRRVADASGWLDRWFEPARYYLPDRGRRRADDVPHARLHRLRQPGRPELDA